MIVNQWCRLFLVLASTAGLHSESSNAQEQSNRSVPLEMTIEPTRVKVFDGEPLLVVVKVKNRGRQHFESDRGCATSLSFMAANSQGEFESLPKQLSIYKIGTASHAAAVSAWPLSNLDAWEWPGNYQRSWDEIVLLSRSHSVEAKVRLKAVCDVSVGGMAVQLASNEVSIEVVKLDSRAGRMRDEILQNDRQLFQYKLPPKELTDSLETLLGEREDHRFCDWGRMLLIARIIRGVQEDGKEKDIDRAIRLYSKMSAENVDLRMRSGFRIMTALSVHQPEHADAIDLFLKDLHSLRAFIPETTILWRPWYNRERYFDRLYMFELSASRDPRLFQPISFVGGADSKNVDLIRQAEEQTGYSLTAPRAHKEKSAECPDGGFKITLNEWFRNQAGHKVFWVKTGVGYECRPQPKLSLIRPTIHEGMLSDMVPE